MTREDLIEHIRRQPFEPFRMTLTTGRTFDIYHPDQVMILRREAIIGVVNAPGGVIIDRPVHADVFHIVTVDPLPLAPTGSNGQPPASPNDES